MLRTSENPDQTQPATISLPSSTTTLSPLISALDAADELLGREHVWNPINEAQERFLGLFYDQKEAIIRIPGIEAKASWKIDEINDWLKSKGYAIQLDPIVPQPNQQPFATASVMDISVEWMRKGEKTQVEYQGRNYPAFQLGKYGVSFFESPAHPHPIVELSTKTGQDIYLTMAADHPGQGFELFDRVLTIRENKEYHPNHYSGVIIPMVKLTEKLNHDWLAGLKTIGQDGLPAWIVQALQETRFRMNEIGARVESAAAMSGLKSLSVEIPYVIDRPFLVWLEQPGVSIPIFTAFVMPDNWQDPGDITQPFS